MLNRKKPKFLGKVQPDPVIPQKKPKLAKAKDIDIPVVVTVPDVEPPEITVTPTYQNTEKIKKPRKKRTKKNTQTVETSTHTVTTTTTNTVTDNEDNDSFYATGNRNNNKILRYYKEIDHEGNRVFIDVTSTIKEFTAKPKSNYM